MKKYLLRSLIILAALAFVSIGVALAHGTPVIAVQPTIVAAGGKITVTGTEMEAGEVFTITLEGPTSSIYLGTMTAMATTDQTGMTTPEAESKATPDSASAQSSEPQEGGFSAAFTILANTPPGSYTVKASPEDGDATETDLTITSPTNQASAEPAMVREPTGELHQLDRSKPTSEIVSIVIAAVVSGGLGLWLVRKR